MNTKWRKLLLYIEFILECTAGAWNEGKTCITCSVDAKHNDRVLDSDRICFFFNMFTSYKKINPFTCWTT